MRASELLATIAGCLHPEKNRSTVYTQNDPGEAIVPRGPSYTPHLYCTACGATKAPSAPWSRPSLLDVAAQKGAHEPSLPRTPSPDTRVIGPLEFTPRGPAWASGPDRVAFDVREVEVVFRDWSPAVAVLDKVEAAEAANALAAMVGASVGGTPLPATIGAILSEAGRSPNTRPPSGEAFAPAELALALVQSGIDGASRPTFLLGILRAYVDAVFDATPGDELVDAIERLRTVAETVDREVLGTPRKRDTDPPEASHPNGGAP